MKRLSLPTIARDGFTITSFESLRNPEIQALAEATYNGLEPGKNANNKLRRGIRWGIYAQDHFTWLDRDTYKLERKFNEEEDGAVRIFSLIPTEFLREPAVEQALQEVFALWEFSEKSTHRAYEVQLSAIRYEPTLAQPALPSPINPHQDMVDGTIIVVNKRGDLVGGMSRLYGLDQEPLYELDLGLAEGLSVRDASLLHQVTVMGIAPGQNWRPGDKALRDVLLVRFQPVGR